MGRLTLWGMQQYDPTILDGIVLPKAMSREDFVTRLNFRLGPAYPYIQVPPVLKTLISTWFLTKQYDFSQMYDALHAQYSPIENYDRTEDRKLKTEHSGTDTDTNTLGTTVETTRKGSETNETSGTDTMKRTGTEKTTETGTEKSVQSGTSTTEQSVSAYDAASYVPREKSQQTPNLDTTRTPDLDTTRTPNLTDIRTPNLTETRTPNLTDKSVNSGSDTKKTDYGHIEDATEHSHIHGNIGVTTNQQMIESELEMRMKYDLYELIIQLFEREFMSRLY